MNGGELHISGVSKSFGGVHALNDVRLDVGAGEIIGLAGPNGAGKSTLLNAISRLFELDDGSIDFDGTSLLSRRAHEVARLGVARTFQSAEHFQEFTVLEFVQMGSFCTQRQSLIASALRLPVTRRDEERSRTSGRRALEALGLSEIEHHQLRDLPYGQQKLVDFARVMSGDPRLILLDEPTSGTQISDRQLLRSHLGDIRAGGVSAIIVDHDVSFLADVVDRLAVLANGTVIAVGEPDAVLSDAEVEKVYTGGA